VFRSNRGLTNVKVHPGKPDDDGVAFS
jgi:hypothetical protein